ncbi:MAG: hypothetical protein Q9167_004849 [Letrouitia subvulpina]
MSGIEVAALILGTIPVVLEAFGRSEKLFEPFRKYRRYMKDIQKLEYQLRTEKAIFSGHCIILLYAITGNRDRARHLFEAMAENTLTENTLAHVTFKRLKRHLHDTLNTNLVACRETITQLQHSLDSLNDSPDVNKAPWYREFGQRIRLELKKTKYPDQVKWIGTVNGYFGTQCGLIRDQLELSESDTKDFGNLFCDINDNIIFSERLRAASRDLYKALISRWDCAFHVKHLVHLCLGDEPYCNADSGNVNRSTNGRIQFRMAIFFQNDAGTLESLPWLLVNCFDHNHKTEYMNQGSGNLSTSLSNMTDVLEAQLGKVDLQDSNDITTTEGFLKPTKFVHFADTVSNPTKIETQIKNKPMSADQSPTQLEKTSIHEEVQELDFYIRQKQFDYRKQACLACLGSTGLHKFSIDSAETVSTETTNLYSLINSIADCPRTPSTKLKKFRLATCLSKLALQFHSTPWLEDSWRSSDIHFFDPNNDKAEKSLWQMIHLRLDLEQRRSENAKGKAVDRDPDFSTSMFHLGIALLELGLTKPWSTLRQMTIQELPQDKASDQIVAASLTRSLVREMGPTYAIMVQKCINRTFKNPHKGLADVLVDLQKVCERFQFEIHDMR